jgi:hypothetical protein
MAAEGTGGKIGQRIRRMRGGVYRSMVKYTFNIG